MNLTFATRLAAIALAGISFFQPAAAQWQWIDKDGKKVFSDRSPGADIPAKNILKQPGGRPLTTVGVATAEGPLPGASAPASAASKPVADTSALKPSGKDTALEVKKKQAEADEAARKKAEEEQIAKARADNCERAKKAQVELKSGVRIALTNAKGEREFMDDAAKTTESKRLQSIAETNCAK